jgi:aspartyl-tRNA(Asn)/glutamyl-tRNA(Gln) amidotransferase subunit A
MPYQTAAEIIIALENKDISSVELTETYLKKIQTEDHAINSFITVNTEEALEQAKQADVLRAANKAAVLTGVPYAHKDIFCTKGLKTSCGSKYLDNFIAPYDATVSAKLKAEGMVLLGKTNMDEFAMGSSNESSFYGSVKNPLNLECVPGGSSGGSAAAIAAGFAPLATGTDTGGSIRQPAAFCGLTGIKPTYGRVSRYGMVAFASSLDQGGALGRTAQDCAYLLKAMAGFDARDSTSVNQEVPDYPALLNQSIKGLKIGVPKEYFNAGLDQAVAEKIQAALKHYENSGAKLTEISLKTTELAIPAYYIIALAECSSNLSRFDGVRYGYRCDSPKSLQDLYERSRSEAFGTEVKRRIMVGTYALSAGYYDAYYLQAQKVRRLIADDFKHAFEKVDVIMGPTTPSPAFKLGEKIEDPVSMYLSDIYTVSVNLAGLPAISIPAGLVNNMPIGLQIIGNYFDEARILNTAHCLQNQDFFAAYRM